MILLVENFRLKVFRISLKVRLLKTLGQECKSVLVVETLRFIPKPLVNAVSACTILHFQVVRVFNEITWPTDASALPDKTS